MRGKPQAQPDFLTVINLNASVPADHPLRAIKRRVDAVLQKLSPLFDQLYAGEGRPSIPPEQLLKARVLTALYSVRSERLFCEQLGYNLLWLWFLDREFAEGGFENGLANLWSRQRITKVTKKAESGRGPETIWEISVSDDSRQQTYTMSLRPGIVSATRAITGGIVFRKKLPAGFGGAQIYVTSRSDVRLLKHGWEACAGDLLAVAGRYIRPGSCVWDIGSNLGIFSFCAAFKSGSAGHCYSLEADPRYAELQNRTSARLPASYAPVKVLCAAIASESGVLELAIPRKGHARNHLAVVSGNSAGETESTKQVVTVTGDFLAKHWKQPDFVKMDVEGAELLALEGSTHLLETARPVFYIEVGEENQKQVTAIFRKLDYRLYRLSSDGTEEPVESCVFNTLARPAEKR